MASAATKSADQDSIKVGSKVRITGTHYATGQKIPNWVKAKAYTVSSISSSKALLDKNGICSWVKLNDLKLDGANTSSGQTTAKTEQKKEEKKEETKTESMNKTGYVSGTGGSGLNVRSGAGTNHSRIGGLAEGASVSIVANKNGWYQIKYGSGTGWVSSSYIKISNNTSNNTSSQSTSKGWSWPSTATYISSPFGYRNTLTCTNGNKTSNMHRGIDIAGGGSATIKAAKAGTVNIVGWDPDGYGKWVQINHGNNLYTRYAHMKSISVSDGQKINAGEQVGKEGSTGNVTGPHLHFEVRDGGTSKDCAKDPLNYVKA